MDWNWGDKFRGIEVHNQPLTTILSTVLGSWKFTLPRVALARGQAYTGSAARVRRVVRKLMNRTPTKPVKIGVIGGSITWGQATRYRGEADWFSLLSKYLLTAFPAANITTRNGCTPGVPAAYMILCLESSVDPDVELVFVEFTVNNGADPSNKLYHNSIVLDMERLIRRILELPSRPAVVLMHVPTLGMAQYPHHHPKNPNREAWVGYYATSEDALGAVNQYYDVQSLSLRSAMYDLAAIQEKDGFRWEQAFVDHHPGNHGHKMMADLAVYMIQSTAMQLLLMPYGPDDKEAVFAPVPRPIYPGNMPPNASMCLLNDNFKNLVVAEASTGFDYINEGTAEKPKPGYIAKQPGAKLRLRLNTERSLVGHGPNTAAVKVQVFFHHLRSYEHMGVAQFSCVSGCQCDPKEVDGHHTEKVSQLYMMFLEVTQHPQCEVEITVLPKTSSGEHKFKVAGAVISERPGADGFMSQLLDHKDANAFGIREHTGDVLQITYTKEGKKGGNDAWARRRRR
ncbi:hypothetical protein HYH02_015038 [Chlamydomonas schloesseri]|uniref:SGNH hydrolase-type esterase domain-containing protein n=1 Tax=Chlamydomonas schloesseri TaxID=2026947 RepID=A0A835SSQ7_9CHLO|nr:hypothetical protein HYH02_015038 [Chlamydomonas schloesseri]|eukprot:KAG2425211.1 hypothetical protein HYH02_015038 [Chlamydomonas schloesseri]